MNAEDVTVNNADSLKAFIDLVKQQHEEHGVMTYRYHKGKRRSPVQNNSLQKYCQNLADALNDAGFDMRHVFKDDADIPWTKNSVREQLWVGIQKAHTGKSSTTQPTAKEYIEIYDILNRYLINKHGVSVPWPSNPESEMIRRKKNE